MTPRFLWALGAVALLLACAPGLWLFAPLAIALGIVLLLGTIADIVLGPKTSAIEIQRTPPAHFALGVRAELAYTIENRSNRAVRIGVLETPVRTLHFDVDEIVGEVPAQSRVTMLRP
ncbi:MAG: hypothetical protein WAK16_07245, partial [Candidatus Cybelea sp.]